LDKVTGEITNRQFLETLKKVISEFGFVIDVIDNITTIYEQNIKKTIHNNTYLIDLDNTIIELLNLTSRDYFDDIMNGVPSNFSDAYDDEKSNEDDDFESDEEYIDMDE
jgi:hypothetical protein